MIPILSNVGALLNGLGRVLSLIFRRKPEHEAGCYSKPFPEGRSGACSCKLAFPRAKP